MLESRLHQLWSEQDGILGRPPASEASYSSTGEPTSTQLQANDAAAAAAAAAAGLEAAQCGDRERLSYWDLPLLRDLVRERLPDPGCIVDIEVAGNAAEDTVLETIVSVLQGHGFSAERARQQFLPEPGAWQLIRAPRKRPTWAAAEGGKFTLRTQSPDATAERPYRWLLQPHEEVQIAVQFAATQCGAFSEVLHFEVVGCPKEYTLECNARCEVPTIETEPKHVFPRRLKQKRPIGQRPYP